MRYLCFALLPFMAATAWADVVPYLDRGTFLAANPTATNTINFNEYNLGSATGTGFLPPISYLGFVTFNTNSNFSHQIIDGTNVGQGTNDVYATLATNKTLTIADVTLGNGVRSIGFDLKNTSGGSGTASLVPQTFIVSLFSGTTLLVEVPVVTIVGGEEFQFAGFHSNDAAEPITRITYRSQGVSPNLDLVLDNFAMTNAVPEPNSLMLGIGCLALTLIVRRPSRVVR